MMTGTTDTILTTGTIGTEKERQNAVEEERTVKFIAKAVLYMILMNAVLFAGACIFDVDFEFNFLFNAVVPVVCAYASWEVEQKKLKKTMMSK